MSYCAHAQSLMSPSQSYIQNPERPLLLSADELIYNRDENTVSAQGNVQIEYDGNKVFAQKLFTIKKQGGL